MSKLLQGLLCLFFSLVLAPNSSAQFQLHPDSSFYTFLDSFYYYYQDDGTEGGLYNRVRRDRMTWGPRLAPDGRMSRATQALTTYTSQYKNIGGTASATGTPLPASYAPNIPWRELGPLTTPVRAMHRGMGQIHRIAFHPQYDGSTNQTVYAGSHYGGLYRSDDGGNQWYNYHTDRGLGITSVSGIAVSNNYVAVCTGNGDYGYSDYGLNMHYEPLRGGLNDISLLHTQGVYFHNNQAGGWQSMNGLGASSITLIDGSTRKNLLEVFEAGGTMRNILVHPTNDNILFLATSLGVFRTTDRGTTWTQVLVGPPDPSGGYFLDTEWRGLEFHPTNPNTVYASGREVYRSTDGGVTWASMNIAATVNTAIRRINITTTLASPNKIYAYVIAYDGVSSGVYCYDGTAWTLFQAYQTTRAEWAAISVSPFRDSIVHIGAIKMAGYEPHPSGTGLQMVDTTMFHDDLHALEYAPHSDTLLFIGNHGGVEVLNTYTDAKERRYYGLGVATIWSFDDWEGDDSLLVLALQDNGIFHTIDHASTWIASNRRSDGYGVALDDHTGTAYTKYNYYDGLYRTHGNLLIDLTEMYLPEITINTVIPLDSGTYGGSALIGNTFPVVNHPKNEQPYVGFSELYRRDYEVYYPDNSYNYATEEVVLEGKSFYSDTASLTLSNFSQNPDGYSCIERGGVVVQALPNFTYQPLSFGTITFERWRRDTLCRLVPPNNYINHAMPLKSDLKKHRSSRWDRRILEIAFSEDDSTNYTYLVTLGDTRRGRRCDFYVNDADAMGCDTCFVVKTAGLPFDPNVASHVGDPNPITGIAVDPLNGKRVWISLSGYGAAYKVYYSDDAGDSWTSWDDANGSLATLNMPINGIVYQRGTNDRLYIATDVGIYVREGQGNWLRYGEAFPNVRVTELKINYCMGKLRAATFGRGMWEAAVLPVEETQALRSFRSVDSSETWTTNKNMSRDIRVKAGATLTLENITLNMPKGGLIVVEPGGELVVEGSTITNLCGQTWQGIEVWGNTSLSQLPPSNQGVLELTNSTIEHAKEAVSPWQVGNFPKPDGTGGTGAILKLRGTTFRNNWRSIGFMRYQNPVQQLRELSYVYDCTFTVDDNSRQEFLGHLSAWDIEMLHIKGCRFNDERSDKTDSYGIFTLSASVQLSSLPVVGSFQRNTFEGLSRGIVLGSTPTSGSNVIDQTDFVDNNRGVVVRAAGGLKIIRNSFEVGGYDSNESTYGLSLLRQGDFVAEQNDFQTATGIPSGRVSLGCWIDNLGSGFNRIRNNTFTNLSVANLAHGNSGFDLSNPQGGVQYHCNGQTGNALDITVNRAFQAPTGAAIAEDQGEVDQPAYNSFSHPLDGSFGVDWHMSNDASALGNINYWIAPSAPTVEVPTDIINVTNNLTTNLGSPGFCDVEYTNLTVFKPIGSASGIATLAELKADYYQVWGEYQQLVQEYSSHPNSTILPGQIGTKGQTLTSKANEVIFYYRNDTTQNTCDSIAVWMGNKVGLTAAYELVEHYWGCQAYTSAINHLSTIGNTYTLTGVVLDNHQDYLTLLNLLHAAYQDNRTEATLTKDEVITLNELAENNHGFAAMKAANIVDFFYNDTYRYHPTLPQEQQEKRLQQAVTKVQQGNLSIYPNPTTAWADVGYQLPEGIEKGNLVVTSTAGVQVLALELSEQQGVLTLNTSGWLTGTYFVVLYTEDKAVEQAQLIIRN
jgi:hypothetical protein